MSAFEDFIQIELPRRPWVASNPDEETVPVRRGAGPRQLEFVSLTDGQVLGKADGTVKGIDIGLDASGSIIPKNYIHTQSVASTTWSVDHAKTSLDYVVVIYDSAGDVIIPDAVEQIDDGNVNIILGSAVTGKAVFIFAS